MQSLKTGMSNLPEPWHYLILTAANDDQAAAYEAQIGMRLEAGQLTQLRDTLVVADPQGRRVGSGGSTLDASSKCFAAKLRGARKSPASRRRRECSKAYAF